MRRRRSAISTPAFVDRMDVADDAAGRVAIFAADEASEGFEPPPRAPVTAGTAGGPGQRLGDLLDSSFGPALIAVGLVVVLVVGLLLSRH
jgi:hypothetical protein